jgi:hypothetical protein
MVPQDDDQKQESRPPTIEDLVRLCRELNARGAKYLVVGGMAMINAGFVRTTEDIDILVEGSPSNQAKVRQALAVLPDNAVRELAEDDLDRYTVVRVADEIVVDLMKSACGIDYDAASADIVRTTIEDVPIPFAGPEMLWRMKQTLREKDKQDLNFLKVLLGREG